MNRRGNHSLAASAGMAALLASITVIGSIVLGVTEARPGAAMTAELSR